MTQEQDLLQHRIEIAAFRAEVSPSKWAKNHWEITRKQLVRRMHYLLKIKPYINERVDTVFPREYF